MTKLKKKVSLFLVLMMIFTFAFPAWAFELTLDPDKTSYQSGESITVSTGDYGDTGGFSWSLTDWENNTTALDGEQNSITFSLPENNTRATADAVVEAVYGGERGSVTLGVEPEETETLQVAELYPANGATVASDTYIYIRFNKPVEVNPDFAGKQYCKINYLPNNSSDYEHETPQTYNPNYRTENILTIDSVDPCKVWIAIGATKNNLLEVNTYYDIYFWLNRIRAKDTGEVIDSQYNIGGSKNDIRWRFNTKTDEVIPAGIQITDYPQRLNVGESYPLQAVVKDKKGDVLDWPVQWDVVSISGGRADIDAAGNITGTGPGRLRLVAWAEGFPDVRVGGKHAFHMEIRQNFNQHLLGVWATELTDREHHSAAAPLVSEDGTIYLTTGSGSSPVTRAYDSGGNKMDSFQEITSTGVPVLAQIDGREYLLAPRDKKMCAFDPATGRLEWESAALNYQIGSVHVDIEGNIYAGCGQDGKIYVFNLDSDRCLWSYFTQISYGGATESPITTGSNGLIYVVGGENKVFCLNNRGELQWQYATPTLGKIPAGVEPDSEGNVNFIEKVCGVLAEFDEYNIYSLDAGGNLRWCINKEKSQLSDLFVDRDDSLYVTINDEVAGTEKLTRLNRADGSVDKEFAVYDCDRFMRPGDGYIYTNKFIFNDNLEVVAQTDLEAVGYADDYYRDLPYMQYSRLALCPDGTLVRSVASAGFAVALEKVTLVDTAGSQPAEIELEEREITLIQGGTRDIFARVKDNQGYLLPNQALTYATADENVATVNEAGKITAVSAGDAQITVAVQGHQDINATITLHVLSPQEVTDIYFIPQHTAPDEVDLEERITSITGVVGEEKVVQLVVRDQRGEVIQDLPVKWTLSDSSVVQMYNYTGGVMGSISKGTAVLNGLQEGTATLKAELEGYTEDFSAQLAVHIEPAPYQILWTLPIEGDWEAKVAYHTQAGDGTLFIANKKKLKAVSSAGDLLWEQDITDQYGFMPATPVVDDDNVYVYDNSGFNLSLAALDREDGSHCWSFTGGMGSVEQVRAGGGGVYLLSDGGKLYGLDPDSGRSLWDSPLDLSGDDGTLGLSGDGELYYASDNQVFHVAGDGSAGLLYTGEEGATLSIKEIAPDGRIILEKKAGNNYSIISIAPDGTKNWEVPVETAVELSCDHSGTVYAVTRTKGGVNPHVYFIGAGGSLQVDRTITASRIVTDYQYKIYYKPLIGSDGIVYLPLARLYAVNAADGELLWQGEFKDGFFKRVPKTATIDDNNVIYLACDDAGFIALKSKVAGVADESGFYIDTSEAGSLKGNTYRNIVFRVRNDNAEDREIRVVMALEGVEGGRVVNYAAAADTLAAGEDKPYNYGLHIPGTGSHRVSIKLLDPANQVITEKILPVN